MKKILLIILFFFFIYNVPFVFLPISPAKAIIPLGLLLLATKKNKDFYYLMFDRRIFSFLFLIILLVLYSAFSNIINLTRDYTFIYTYVLFILEYSLGCFVFIFFFKQLEGETKKDSLFIYFDALIIIGLIQSVLIYLMLFVPSFRELSFSLINDESRLDLSEKYGGFRGLGYASSVTYDFSVFQSLLLMIIPFATQTANSSKKFILYGIAYFLILGTVFISGRSGLLGFVLSILIYFYSSFKINSNSISINNNFFRILKVVGFVLIILVIYYVYFIPLETKFYIEDTIVPFAFEFIINFIDSGQASTKSSDILFNMYFPIDNSTLFWGDGYYESPSGRGFYMATDAGYMRQVLYYGVFGSALLYGLYLLMLKNVFNSRYATEFKALFLLIIAYMFIVQYKGDIMLGSPYTIKFIFLMYFLLLRKHKYLEYNSNLLIDQKCRIH